MKSKLTDKNQVEEGINTTSLSDIFNPSPIKKCLDREDFILAIINDFYIEKDNTFSILDAVYDLDTNYLLDFYYYYKDDVFDILQKDMESRGVSIQKVMAEVMASSRKEILSDNNLKESLARSAICILLLD